MKHIVGFSGGIDSQACARWVLNRFPAEDVILLNSNAGGNEHPLTEAFVNEYSDKVHPVVKVIAISEDIERPSDQRAIEAIVGVGNEVTFSDMATGIGTFPTGRNQFCTTYLKLAPQRRWMRQNLMGIEFMRYSGVRRDESQKRKSTAISGWDDYYDCEFICPIADWTKQMCFDYARAHGEIVNPLYSLGFSRVGCAPCVNANKQDIRQWADRFPESIDKVRDWEKRANRTFFRPMVPGISARISPTGKMDVFNWIDEVVSWAKTDFGGRQFNILRNLDTPSCESRFGLCE